MSTSPSKPAKPTSKTSTTARATSSKAPWPLPVPSSRTYVAVDFETADHGRDSACAIGMVRVEGGEIVDRFEHLIRPPRRDFVFTYIHGISWNDVRHAPTFAQLWPQLARFWDGADVFVAHNAPFDRGVMNACCGEAGLAAPTLPWRCTVELARQRWSIFPTKLNDVARHLAIPLRHHDASSDAEACARIVMAAM